MQLGKELSEPFDIESFFEEAVRDDRLASPYLFSGDNYSRKREIACYLSRALNCRNFRDGRECACDTCVKIENSNHPDVVWIKPVLGQKIKVEHIRSIIRRLYLRPYAARRKIFILENAENLTEEAQNAFLKTLEESPAGCLIVLMARQKELLLETVVSRCQVVNFFSNVPTEKPSALIKDFLLSRNRLELLGELAKSIERKELEEILDSLLIWFRDALICKTNKENLCINTDKENMPAMKEMASRYSLVKLERVIQEINHLRNLIQHNINHKIILSILALALEE